MKPKAPIQSPFVFHEGRLYVIPDWSQGETMNDSVLVLLPLTDEEAQYLVTERNEHVTPAQLLQLYRLCTGTFRPGNDGQN